MSRSITEAGFDNFKGQVQEVLTFLQDNYEKLQRVREVPGVEYANLDFGIEHKMANWTSTLHLPPELLKLVGELELSIDMSLYNDMFFRSKKKRRRRKY
ncbi:MAG: hypothetical protein EOP56_15580 [Sphingobacteriales bacterium]|nr:MAG: hypothetical protein EOP56_15580 [Sphingobacteriales bacterium]